MDNSTIEFYILVLITKSETFLSKLGEYLYTEDVKELTKRSYFDNRHAQTFFNLCYYVFNKTNKLASLRDIEFLVSNIYKGKEQLDDIMDMAHDVFQFDDEINWQLIEEEALKFVKDRKFIEALSESQKDLENKDYDAVIEKLQKSTQVSFDSDYGVSIKDWDEVKEILKEVADTSNASPTGYDMLDSEGVLNGGFRPKELEVIAANSGVGKTLMLCNLAVNFALSGKNVMYISMETSAARLTSRIIANLMDVPTTNINYNISEDDEEIKKDWENSVKTVPGELRIKEFATNSMSANQIETYLLDMRKNIEFIPDVVCVDYLSICRPNDRKISKENSYIYDKTIAEDLRAMAYHLDCIVITGAQINRDGLKDGATKSTITTEDIANSIGIEFTADFILTLSMDKTHQKMGQIKAYVAKNRNNEKGQEMMLQKTGSCRLVEIKEHK